MAGGLGFPDQQPPGYEWLPNEPVFDPERHLALEGAAVLLDSARRLRPFARRAGNRIENTVRGGCYRSRWLRDLCTDARVTDMMSRIYGTADAYVSLDRSRADQSRSRDLIAVDDPKVLYTEWARHAAWRAQGRLESLVDGLEFGLSAEAASGRLAAAIEDVQEAIDDMRAGEREAEHYEADG